MKGNGYFSAAVCVCESEQPQRNTILDYQFKFAHVRKQVQCV